MAEPFPDSPFFRGPEAPGRFECELYDCIVYGKIPKEIDGTWYRVVLLHHISNVRDGQLN